MQKTESRIFIAGHEGMVGSAIQRELKKKKDILILTASRSELDLTNQSQVLSYFKKNKIDEVYLAAARVGGINANVNYPADFIYENLAIQSNVIHSSHLTNVNKLILLGSSCIYPKESSQPISEASLLSGYLEKTNEDYAIAKIAGIKMCESYNAQYSRDYRCVMPTNLYGPNDNFNLQNSHVIPGLLHRFYLAIQYKEENVKIWGSGQPRREFLFVDDLAKACIFVMSLDREKYTSTLKNLPHINIGSGDDISISELANIISKITGFTGEIYFDSSQPDGVYRKLIDSTMINSLGWSKSTSIQNGLKDTYQWFISNYKNIRK